MVALTNIDESAVELNSTTSFVEKFAPVNVIVVAGLPIAPEFGDTEASTSAVEAATVKLWAGLVLAA